MSRIIKRVVALSLAFIMTIMSSNIGVYKGFAVEGDEPTITHVYITKIYENGLENTSQTKLIVRGTNLDELKLSTIKDGSLKEITSLPKGNSYIHEYIVHEDELGEELFYKDKTISLNMEEVPTLTGTSPKKIIFNDSNSKLKLSGSNLNLIYNQSNKYNTYFRNNDVQIEINNDLYEDNEGEIVFENNILTNLGVYDYAIKKTDTNDGVTIELERNYKNQFSVVKLIETSDLIMAPNVGIFGEEVQFTASAGLSNLDVFFVKDPTKPIKNSFKGTDTVFNRTVDGKEILSTHIPPKLSSGDDSFEAGEYYIILTNKIPSGKEPEEFITKYLLLEDKFTVIDAKPEMTIMAVIPNKGSDLGVETKLSGRYFGTLNIPGLNLENDEINIDSINSDETLKIEYGQGKYSTNEENSYDVEKVTKTINVIIGDKAKFKKNSDGNVESSFGDIDHIAVITQPVTYEELSDPRQDVIVETVTTIKLDGVDNELIFRDVAIKENGFTFIPSTVTPIIEEVVPYKIQVVGNRAPYKISDNEDRLIAIYGENFFIHKYVEDGVQYTRYPIIKLGNSVELNKNEGGTPDLELRVFDENGNELDGSEGNELGTKILVKVPAGTLVPTSGKTWVEVINPLRQSSGKGLDGQKIDALEFVKPPNDDTPIIEEVIPNIVPIEGNVDVEIIGTNFKSDVQVIISGKVIEDITVQGDGKKISFTAPKGDFEGETQLQVVNPEGGIAIYPFIYVKTYTIPSIIDFSPKRGTHDTLVVLTGENLLKPDPTGNGDNMFKFIGTRILLEGQDINEYNLNSNNKVQLIPYKANADNKILDINDDEIIKDYYNSLILENRHNNKYYVLDKSKTGKISLSNGIDKRYEIKKVGNRLEAHDKDGGVYEITLEEDGDYHVIKLSNSSEDIRLHLYTPYKVIDNVIVGNKVRVLSIDKLYFTIPKTLPNTNAYYDVTIKNPDTKEDTRANEQGFYYLMHPASKPIISSIEPEQGSVDGGYYITINGDSNPDGEKCFTDDARVSINGVLIPVTDIEISSDGLSIEVKVPELTEEIEGNRITVPVVVVNGDGASASKEDGFTYVKPYSNPHIDSIFKDRGKASGGYTVEITGTEFRFSEPYEDTNRNGVWDIGEPYTNLNNWHINTDSADDGTKGPDSFSGKNVNDLKNRFNEEYRNIHGKDYYDIVVPVLPKVYFGGKLAEITDFAHGYLNVVVPEGKEGVVDVYIVNPDMGISNSVQFTYETSNPNIEDVIPSIGDKKGGEKVEIKGSELFLSPNRKLMYKDGNNVEIKEVKMPLVRFGNITNKEILKGEENDGGISNGIATVLLDGNLEVRYNGVEDKLKLKITVGDKDFEAEVPYHDEKVFIPTTFLTYTDENGNIEKYATDNPSDEKRYEELILINVDDRRLFVERGYSPSAEYISNEHVIVTTPSYYTVGQVGLNYINSDGGVATTSFEFKNPSSRPEIININKDGLEPIEKIIDDKLVKLIRVNYKGGNTLSVKGLGFVEDATIYIGDIATIDSGDIKYQIPDKMDFIMPEVDESAVGNQYRVVVVNPDGGNASSDELSPPIYIQIIKGETEPTITSINPKVGPAKGGTEVTIIGNDFRDNLKVILGDQALSMENIKSISTNKIVIVTPPHSPGEVDVKVENEDGELAISDEKYTYVSQPKIAEITDKNNKYINTISILGDEKIIIKGSGFLEGATIVFAPVLRKATDEDSEYIYIEGEKYVVESGYNATAEFVSEGELNVTTPAGKLEEKGIIVINPDKGATPIYSNVKYSLPQIDAPINVWAQLYYDRYIKVNWDKVEKATQYEIHVIKNGKKQYVGNTELNSFVYKDISTRTRYTFVITAIGEYGSSIYSVESNEVRTGSKVYNNEDGDIDEKTTITSYGSQLVITLGKDDYEDFSQINLTEYNNAEEVIINIPATILGQRDIQTLELNAPSYIVKFNPNTFYSYKSSKESDGIKFKVKAENSSYIPPNRSIVVSKELSLEGFNYKGNNLEKIHYTGAYIYVGLDVDTNKAYMRRLKNIELMRLDEENSLLQKTATSEHIAGLTDRLGKFIVLGGR